MHLNLKWVFASFLSLTALASSADDSFHSYGPGWDTLSIPGAEDRYVSEENLNAAVKTCFLTGDKSRHIISLSQQMMKQLLGHTYDVEEAYVGTSPEEATNPYPNTFLALQKKCLYKNPLFNLKDCAFNPA